MKKLGNKKREAKRSRKQTEDIEARMEAPNTQNNAKDSNKAKARRRKTADEIYLLEKCFLEDQEWTRETVDYIQANSQLTLTQIYKWGWDQKKKVMKNPNGVIVPTIDEFGGYSKFEASDESNKITKVIDIDWNHKIHLLDLDCQKEEMENKAKTESIVHENNKDSEKADRKCDSKSPIEHIDSSSPPNSKSFSTPLKKPKRERYSSDVTNATVSGKNLLQKQSEVIKGANLYVTPFYEDELEKDYSFENYNFDNFDNFEPHSFIMQNEKVYEGTQPDKLSIFQKSASLEPFHEPFGKFFWE